MTHSTYTDALVLATRALKQTRHILEIAQKHVTESGASESTILALTLAPDMFPFTRQIQSVSDNAKGLASRVSGIEAPSMMDTEASLAELIARIDATLAFVTSVSPMDSEAIDAQEVSFHWLPNKGIKGHDCILLMNIPNLYFHFSMAYANLRSHGIPVGKMDFLGTLPFYDKK